MPDTTESQPLMDGLTGSADEAGCPHRAPSVVDLERARLEGVLLAARTMQHLMNNQLALTVGYCDLLAALPELSERARRMALEALRGADEASATLAKLGRIRRLEFDTSVDSHEPLLDVERSIDS